MAHDAEEGSLIFIQEGSKRRPHICIKVYRNNAGVPYNWLVLPITSCKTVGDNNLFKVDHPKLNKISYAKLNNMRTIVWDDSYEVKNKINLTQLDKLITKICKSLKYVNKRKTKRSTTE